MLHTHPGKVRTPFSQAHTEIFPHSTKTRCHPVQGGPAALWEISLLSCAHHGAGSAEGQASTSHPRLSSL